MANEVDLYVRIKADLKSARAALDQLEKGIGDVGASGKKASQGTETLARSADNAAAAFKRMALQAAAAFGVIREAQAIVDAGLAIERIERGLRQATGSAEAARREWDFLRRESDRLGVSLRDAAGNYTTLAAAARGTTLEGEATRQVFLGVVEAFRALDRPAADLDRALTAVQQIISKGKVSAEELTGQLGDVLPGALQIAARSLNVTTAELSEMLARGEVMADEFLPRFAEQLREEFGQTAIDAAQGASAAFARFQNALFEVRSAAADSGLIDALRVIAEEAATLLRTMTDLGPRATEVERSFEGLRDFMRTLGKGVRIVADAFRDLGDLIGAVAASIEVIGDIRTNGLDATLAKLEAIQSARIRFQQQIRDERAAAFAELEAGGAAAAGDGGGFRTGGGFGIGLPEPAGAGGSGPGVGGGTIRPPGTDAGGMRDAVRVGEDMVRLRARWIRQNEQAAESLRRMVDPSRALQAEIDRINKLMAGGFINTDEAAAAIRALRDRYVAAQEDMQDETQATGSVITEVLGDNLFRRFDDGLKGMLAGWTDTLRRMQERALTAQIYEALGLGGGQAGAGAGGQGGAGAGGFAGLVGPLLQVLPLFLHRGGVVGSGAGWRAPVPAAAFAGAPRFHNGGFPGLSRDEVPAVLQRGEEVLTRDDPRHAANGGGGGGVRILNVIDPALVGDYMGTSAAEDDVLNIISRRRDGVAQILRG